MKLPTKILMMVIVLAGMTTMAFRPIDSDPVARILPSGDRGLLKLLYYNPGEKSVQITFYDATGIIFRERLKSYQFKNGFVKNYDVRNLKDGIYWVEISDSELSVKYQVSFEEDKMWVNYWNNYSPQHQAIAKN